MFVFFYFFVVIIVEKQREKKPKKIIASEIEEMNCYDFNTTIFVVVWKKREMILYNNIGKRSISVVQTMPFDNTHTYSRYILTWSDPNLKLNMRRNKEIQEWQKCSRIIWKDLFVWIVKDSIKHFACTIHRNILCIKQNDFAWYLCIDHIIGVDEPTHSFTPCS